MKYHHDHESGDDDLCLACNFDYVNDHCADDKPCTRKHLNVFTDEQLAAGYVERVGWHEHDYRVDNLCGLHNHDATTEYHIHSYNGDVVRAGGHTYRRPRQSEQP